MKNNPAKIYKRDLRAAINKYLAKPEILAIKGPRQAGKTTFLKTLQQELSGKSKTIFITFEDREKLDIFEQDIQNFIKLFVAPYETVFIDEFQYAKNGGQKLKYLFDTTSTKFIISGSSSLELTFQTGKYLVGRIFSFYLMPFNFNEFLQAREPELAKLLNIKRKSTMKLIQGESNKLSHGNHIKSHALQSRVLKLLEEYIIYGGYPRVIVAGDEEEKRTILKEIINNYLLYDIKGLLELVTSDKLLLLAKALALQIGNLVEYQELGILSGLGQIEIKKHLRILQETYILELISPYFSNKRTELVKNPKVYFTDPGIRHSLLNNFSKFMDRSDRGALLENYVHQSLRQHT
ncbi:MAG: ATP-binding protein, partial [bacterium]|nr:ATP-binding protein [bacterium]